MLTPRKHYATEVIENVVDDVSTPNDLSTENYPCIRTMERWKEWIRQNTGQIEGLLRSIRSRLSTLGKEHLHDRDSLFQKLRDNGCGWLSAIQRMIYNTGGWIPSKNPSEGLHLLCFDVPGSPEVYLSP